jgi:hypothetical protein
MLTADQNNCPKEKIGDPSESKPDAA